MTQPRLERLAKPNEADQAVLQRVVLEEYPANLAQCPEAQAYLAKRRLNDPYMVDYFKLGYANRTLGYKIPDAQVKEGAALRDQLQRIGIYRASGHEHFAGCLTIPILGSNGEVLEVYGRKVGDNHLRKGTPKHLYLPARGDGRRGVFNFDGFAGRREVILCEALIDALTFWQAGFHNVTTADGAEGFTAELKETFLKYSLRRLLIAYDSDHAGDRAAEALAQDLGAAGIEVLRIHFPIGFDANKYAFAVRPASEGLGKLVASARWMAGPRPVVVVAPVVEVAAEAREQVGGDNTVAETSPAVSQADSQPSEEAALLTSIIMPAPGPETHAVEPPPAGIEPQAECDSQRRADKATCAKEGISAPVGELKAAVRQGAEATSETVMVAPPLVTDGDKATKVPAPAAPEQGLQAEVLAEEVRIPLGDRRWRVRGLSKTTSYESLHVNLLVARDDRFFVDNLELYSARARAAFQKDAARELKVDEDVLHADLGRILRKLEELVHQQITKALELDNKPVEMTSAERDEALELLKDPRLLDRILEDVGRAGVVGEKTNMLVGYLAATSRKLEAPLAVVIQSSSAAGKSSLMQAILQMISPEEIQAYTAMTPQSLYYLDEAALEHKILAIAEEEGAQSASYALKLLQSEGEISIASTGKDATTGRHVTHHYVVKGPVMIFLTTTAIDVDPELMNRCIVLTVDEGPEQTAAIHERQREARTLEGLLARTRKKKLLRLHQNAQRLLEPLAVVNPLAKGLRFPHRTTRARRDHMKYLTLIDTIALLHQHQRPVKETAVDSETVRYIGVTPADIQRADQLAEEVLAPSTDELPPQTRRLLGLIEEMVAALAKRDGVERRLVRFTRKDVRAHTRWSDAALKKHLGRLEDLEHLVLTSGGARRRMIYELAVGAYDGELVTLKGIWSPPGHPLVTPEGRPEDSAPALEKPNLVTLTGKEQFRRPANGASGSETKRSGSAPS